MRGSIRKCHPWYPSCNRSSSVQTPYPSSYHILALHIRFKYVQLPRYRV
jgi:hypothetical protein